MEAYPKKKTWPYVVLVIILFALAIAFPNWTDRHDEIVPVSQRPRQRMLAAISEARRITIDFRPDWQQQSLPRLEPLQAPVAERVTVGPAPEFMGSADSQTAEFPRPVQQKESGDYEIASPIDLPQVPQEPDGDPVDREPVQLEITPTDADRISTSLPEPHARPLPPNADAAAASAPNAWPVPTTLTSLLNQLPVHESQTAAWLSDVNDHLLALESLPSIAASDARLHLKRLQQLATATSRLEAYHAEPARVILRRINYGIQRRTEVWLAAHALELAQRGDPSYIDVTEAIDSIRQVDQQLRQHEFYEAWRNYLTIPELTRIATETWVSDPTVRRQAARRVIERLASDDLTTEQQQIVNHVSLRKLQRQLETWAYQPIDTSRLLCSIEQYEESRSPVVAEQLVQLMDALAYSRHAAAAPLRRSINRHYRNANLRFTVTSKLLNDLLPVLEPMQQRIRDTILGADVVGQNRTLTDLNLRLVPHNEQLHLRIVADGTSHSRTVSSKGPVRFFSRDRSRFASGKDLMVRSDGVFVTHAKTVSQGRSQLLDVESDYDQIPLLGWIIRQMALDEHHEQRGIVRNEVQHRVRRRVGKQLDQSIHERLNGAEDRIETLLQPLHELNLDPKTVEMRTTQDRLVMRFRLAAPYQLAAYTPRPRALANNVLSLQLHESTANNLIDQLHLEDQQIELDELMTQLSEKLRIERKDIHEEIPEGVELHLGSERPIQFEFCDDRVLISVRIKKLKTRRRSWRNFVVRGRYRANVSQTHVDLQRDGGIELISEQLGFRDQIALRGIFTKALARNHRLSILRGRVKNNAQLNNLGVSQFTVRDGWIGISVGPQPKPPRVASSDGASSESSGSRDAPAAR